MKKIVFTILLLLSPVAANAIENCGLVSVKGIVIQADREIGSPWANTMRINISGSACAGIDYAYLKNAHPAYNSILSLLLSAQARGINVSVRVKSSTGISATAREIEYITL